MVNEDTINELVKHDKRKEMNLSDFIKTGSKLGGSRWGAIGHFGDGELYLLKREHSGYQTISSTTPNCVTILECLCSKIIGKVLGEHYIAETIPVKINCETIKVLHGTKIETENIVSEEYDDYAVASKWLSYQQTWGLPLVDHTVDDDHMLKFALMCNLLGIDDVKVEHYIRYITVRDEIPHVYTAIIDCAGDLSAFEETDLSYFLTKDMYKDLSKPKVTAKPEQYQLVLEVFTEFLKIDVNKEFEEYQHIPSPLLEQMKINLQKTLDHVRNNLLPQLEILINEVEQNKNRSINYSVSFYKPESMVKEPLNTLTPTTNSLI